MARIDTMQEVYRGTAPIVRKLAADPELREDLRNLIKSGQRVSDRLMSEAGAGKAGSRLRDRHISEQVDRIMDVLAERKTSTENEPRHWRRWAIVAGAAGGAIVVLLAPKTGPAVRGRIVSLVRSGDEEQPVGKTAEWAA